MERRNLRPYAIIIFALALVMLCSMPAVGADEAISSNQTGFVEDEIIVHFQPGTSDQRMTDIVNEFRGSIEKTLMGPDYKLVRVPAGTGGDEIVNLLNSKPEVIFAEKNVVIQTLMTPNDPLYQYQWNFNQLNMPRAWDITNGGGAVVAVVDTGVAYENYGGFRQVSDLAGTNFVPGHNFIDNTDHANDDHYHGTHVAGTIAQTTNNNLGTAGTAPGVSIMPVKVLNSYGYGSVSGVADGIRWAADNGADVINLSLGSSYPSQTLEDAVNYARQIKNVVVVASAGNSGGDLGYPARYDSVISVAATDYNQAITYYSSRGAGLDISAPGGDTSVDRNGDGKNDGIMQQTIGYRNPAIENYYLFQGTSMAAPHVSGTAALLIANGITNANEVQQNLQASAKDLGAPGYDTTYGYGLVDAAAALDAEPLIAPQLTYPLGGETLIGGNTVDIAWNTNGASNLAYNIEYTADAGPGGAFSDGFENGGVSSDYQNGGSLPWDLNTAERHQGGGSIRSGAVGNSQSSEISVTKNITAPGSVSFWYKVSSEYYFDYLNFYVDGVKMYRWSGEAGWAEVSVPVTPGQHTFKWTYEKDYSVAGGSDAAWIDDISITNTASSNWTTIAVQTAPGANSYSWRLPEIDSDRVRVRVRAKNGGVYSDWSESGDFTIHQKPISETWWESGVNNWEAKASRPVIGDFDGDGKDDMAVLYGYGGARSRLFFFKANGNGFDQPVAWWDSGPGNWDSKNSKIVAGDFDGDGKSDLAVIYNYGGASIRTWMFKSTGSGFEGSRQWWNGGAGNWEWSAVKPTTGDFDNDGDDDIVLMYGYSGNRSRLFVQKTGDNEFGVPRVWWDSGPGNWDAAQSKLTSGDFNGDLKTDLSVLYNYDGGLTRSWTFTSGDNSFNNPSLWWDSGKGNWEWSSSKPVAGDLNNDGRDDLAIMYGYGGSRSVIWTLASNINSFSGPQATWDSGPGRWEWHRSRPLMGDFVTDGTDQIGVFYDHGQARSCFYMLEY